MDERKARKLLWVLVFVMNLIVGVKGVAGDMERWQITVHAFFVVLVFSFFWVTGKKNPVTHNRKAVYEYADERTVG